MNTASMFRCAIGITAFALGSVNANAADSFTDLHTIIPGYEASLSITKPVGSFTDTWAFNVTQPLFADGSVSNFPSVITFPTPITRLNISGLTVNLYSGIFGDIASDPLLGTLTGTPDLKFGSGLFPSGDYYFQIAGIGDGATGGRYVFSVNTFAAPVPEPESYAMFLAGLGVMGAIAIRRNKKKRGA